MVPGGAPQMAFPGQLLVVGLCVCWGGGVLVFCWEGNMSLCQQWETCANWQKRDGYLKMVRMEDKMKRGVESCRRGWCEKARGINRKKKWEGAGCQEWGNSKLSCKQVTGRKKVVKLLGKFAHRKEEAIQTEEKEDKQRLEDRGRAGATRKDLPF